MSANGGPSRLRNVHQPTERNLLAKVHIDDLKLLRVAVRRGNVTSSASAPQPMERGIDDPAKICALVHFRKGDEKVPRPPIFGRNIKVNQEFNQEERWVLTDANRLNNRVSKSRSSSRSRTPSSLHYSSRRKHSKSRSPSRRSRISRTPRRSRSRDIKSKSVEKRRIPSSDASRRRDDSDRIYDQRPRTPSRDRDKYRVRSRTPGASSYHGRPKESTVGKDRYRKRSKSPTPLRPGEYRPNHPDLKLRERDKNRSVDKEGLQEKYRSKTSRSLSRERRSGPVRRSQSPYHKSLKRYASRSPRREKDPSPVTSRAVRRSRTPTKEDKASFRNYGAHVSPRYRSRSPLRKERKSRSPGGSHRSQDKKGALKPYRRPSRSPTRYETPKRRSRSPRDYRANTHYRRSRSPHSRHYYKGRSPTSRKRSRSPPHYHGEPVPAEYMYNPEFWGMPGPIRPGFAAPYPRFYPPMYSRGMIPPGAPLMIPRMPMISHFAPFPRQPLPNYNSGAVRPKVRPAIRPSATITSVNEEGSKGENEEGSSKGDKEGAEKADKKEGNEKSDDTD